MSYPPTPLGKPWRSTLPQAVAALVSDFKQIPLDGEVRDGPAVGNADAHEVISVGFIGPDDDASAEATFASGGLGGPAAGMREDYLVHCAVAVAIGEEDPQAARIRAFELLGLCGQWIAVDGDLHGSVVNVGLQSWALREDMTTGGAVARIRFDVSVQAWAGR